MSIALEVGPVCVLCTIGWESYQRNDLPTTAWRTQKAAAATHHVWADVGA